MCSWVLTWTWPERQSTRPEGREPALREVVGWVLVGGDGGEEERGKVGARGGVHDLLRLYANTVQKDTAPDTTAEKTFCSW